jgi:hypothetical protein
MFDHRFHEQRTANDKTHPNVALVPAPCPVAYGRDDTCSVYSWISGFSTFDYGQVRTVMVNVCPTMDIGCAESDAAIITLKLPAAIGGPTIAGGF